jgi:hypothetical protein
VNRPEIRRRLVAALLLIVIFHAAAFVVAAGLGRSGWSDGYLIHYARWGMSVEEGFFKFHLLLFVLPAIVLASIALADLWGERVIAAFDSLRVADRARWWPLLAAAVMFVSSMAVRAGALGATPITDDEFAYEFEARLLASGRLYAESLPRAVRPFFDNQFIVNDGRWFAVYFIGHPAVLALASRLGVRAFVGPLLGACTLLLGVGIARRVGGERVAVIATMLTALSPFFVFMSATELSEPTSACCVALLVYAALRVEDEPSRMRWWCVAAGALATGVFVRPQSAVMYPLPVAVRLAAFWRTKRIQPRVAGPAAAAMILAAGAAAVLAVNHALTGSVWRTSHMAYFDQGAVWEYPVGPDATLDHLAVSVAQLNFWLFGWPISLAFLPFFRAYGRTWMLAALVGVVVLGYACFAVPMVMAVGPVYYAELILPLAVLSASGLECLVLRLRRRFDDGLPSRAVILAPAVSCVAAILTFVPVEIASLRRMTAISRAPYDLVSGEHRAVVFIARKPENPIMDDLPSTRVPPGSWVLFHRNASTDLSDDVLFVRDHGERNAGLLAYLPDRVAYRLGMRGLRLELTRLDGSVVRSVLLE